MTIGRRLTLSYAVLLLLGAANLGLYLGTSRLRSQSMHTLNRALGRQLLLSSIRQDVDDLHKQVAILSDLDFGSAGDSGQPEGRQTFDQKVKGVTENLARFKSMAAPADLPTINEVQKQYDELAT